MTGAFMSPSLCSGTTRRNDKRIGTDGGGGAAADGGGGGGVAGGKDTTESITTPHYSSAGGSTHPATLTVDAQDNNNNNNNMTMTKFVLSDPPRVFALAVSVLIGCVGIMYLVDPAGSMLIADIDITSSPTGRTEIRGIYAGVHLALSTFLFWNLLFQQRQSQRRHHNAGHERSSNTSNTDEDSDDVTNTDYGTCCYHRHGGSASGDDCYNHKDGEETSGLSASLLLISLCFGWAAFGRLVGFLVEGEVTDTYNLIVTMVEIGMSTVAGFVMCTTRASSR